MRAVESVISVNKTIIKIQTFYEAREFFQRTFLLI